MEGLVSSSCPDMVLFICDFERRTYSFFFCIKIFFFYINSSGMDIFIPLYWFSYVEISFCMFFY